MIALDTHALLWWTVSPAKLSAAARRAIEGADALGISAIVFFEVALLARKRKVNLGTTVAEWTQDVLSVARVVSIDVTPAIAVQAEVLDMHADPADRLIVASALARESPLVTRDALIRKSKLVRTIW